MKKLFIIRHGDYGNDYRLNEAGEKQMTDIAEKVRARIDSASVLMISSTAPRATDSASVLGKILQINYEGYEVLWEDKLHHGNFKESLDIIDSKKNLADAVLVVTHLEFTSRIPNYFAKEVLKIYKYCKAGDKGDAWEVDFENQKISYIFS